MASTIFERAQTTGSHSHEDSQQKAENSIRETLLQRFSLDELKILCSDMQIEVSFYGGRPVEDVIDDIVALCTEEKLLSDLEAYVVRQRPAYPQPETSPEPLRLRLSKELNMSDVATLATLVGEKIEVIAINKPLELTIHLLLEFCNRRGLQDLLFSYIQLLRPRIELPDFNPVVELATKPNDDNIRALRAESRELISNVSKAINSLRAVRGEEPAQFGFNHDGDAWFLFPTNEESAKAFDEFLGVGDM